MREQIELQGASGAKYRFRLVKSPDKLPAEGGNFVYAKHDGERVQVICFGAGESLHQAGERWDDAVKELGADAIYVRLNIASKTRLFENDDLQAAFKDGQPLS